MVTIILDDILPLHKYLIPDKLESINWFDLDQEHTYKKFCSLLLNIAGKYYNLSTAVGYELWTHNGNKLARHQDKDENDFSFPVLSISLGCSAIFKYGKEKKSLYDICLTSFKLTCSISLGVCTEIRLFSNETRVPFKRIFLLSTIFTNWGFFRSVRISDALKKSIPAYMISRASLVNSGCALILF